MRCASLLATSFRAKRDCVALYVFIDVSWTVCKNVLVSKHLSSQQKERIEIFLHMDCGTLKLPQEMQNTKRNGCRKTMSYDQKRNQNHYSKESRAKSDRGYPVKRKPEALTAPSEETDEGLIIGRNAVRELLKSGRDVDKIFIQRGEREGSIVALIAEARERHIPIIEADRTGLDRMSGNAVHQGIVAMAAVKEYCTVEDILEIARIRGEKPFVVIADGITDPHNLGAIIRCAEGVGAHGLIIPKRRAVGLTPVVSKASCGAIEHLAVAKVSNLSAAIDRLRDAGLWIFAAEAGGVPYYETDFSCPVALVLGSEGNGVSHVIKEKADYITAIPMYGKVNSFNVSTAAAVLLAEISKQHRSDCMQG